MKKIISVLLTGVLLGLTLTGCAQQASKNLRDVEKQEDKINIIATIFPQYDFARAIAGDKADLTMLLKPGAEVHSFDPSPADIIKIQNADVFIYIGGESDEWVKSILSSMDTSKMKIIKLIDCVAPVEEKTVEGMEEEENGQEQSGTEYDEHIWTSPANAILMMNKITEVLCEIDGANAEAYRENAAAYNLQIQKVDDEIREIVDNASNKLLIFGDRFPFQYLAEEFGLNFRAAFPGCSTETEASAGTMAYLMDTVKENKMPYIYYIELSNQNIAKAITEQTGAGMLLLHSCQNVSRDDFHGGVTYLSLMRQNAENLRKGLN